MPEEERKEVEMTEEARAELEKINWGEDDQQPPGEGDLAADYKEEASPKEAEEEEAKGGEVDTSDGTEYTAEQLTEMATYEKRFKDTQSAFTASQQENARLQQEIMAQRMLQPQFPPERFVPEYPPPQQQQEGLQYATDTERQLTERLDQIERRQTVRDHEARLAAQQENVRRADEIVSKFRTAHSDMKDDEVGAVIGRANAANTFDLDLVYRGMRDYNAEIAEAKKAAVHEYTAKLKDKQKANLESSGGAVKPPEKVDYSRLTDEQQHDLMVAKLRELEGG